jgi:succinate dehydrogenase / fumarate reductase cytochrome b subunit
MRRVMTLYRSSVGKKYLMALSGAFLFLFLVGHMVGNLKIFLGQDSFNHYAEWLREVGYPALPHAGFLWIFRLLLMGAIGVHVVAAYQTWQQSRSATGSRYAYKLEDLSFSYASRTMRWGGVIILLFVIYHLAHFTIGSAHPNFVRTDPYSNVVIGFQSPVIAGFYLVAITALALHLFHGLWSATQTLGAAHPKYDKFRRPVAMLLTLVIYLGFISVPISILTGIVS